MNNKRKLVIPILIALVAIALFVNIFIILRFNNESRDSQKVLGLQTVSKTNTKIINDKLESAKCKEFISADILRDTTGYYKKFLETTLYTTFSIQDLGKNNDIIKNCLYTLGGGTKFNLIIHKNNVENTSLAIDDFEQYSTIIKDNISKQTFGSTDELDANARYRIAYGVDKIGKNCKGIIYDMYKDIVYGELSYSNVSNCSDPKNIDLNFILSKLIIKQINSITKV